MPGRYFFPFLFAFLLAACPAHAGPISIESRPVEFSLLEPDRTRFGELEYMGGVVLVSGHKRFGGFSGLMLYDSGTKMLAVSDRGWWLSANLVAKNGKLAGLQRTQMGPLLNNKGKRWKKKGHRDAESIALYGATIGSGILVGFERTPRIERYVMMPDGLTGPGTRIKVPRLMSKGPNNRELESVGRFVSGPNKGRYIVISERHLSKKGNIIGFVFGPDGQDPEQFTIKRRNSYSVTDLAILAGGDVVILERRLSKLFVPSVALRLIPAAAIAKGKPADGKVLMEASAPMHAVDNMEGLNIHRGAQGRLIFTLISDDNFNRTIQRTLLLQFAWAGK